MKTNVVLLGAGSVYFTKAIVEALIRDGGEWDLRLVDVDPEVLGTMARLSQALVDHSDAPLTIGHSTDRRDVLPGADVVVATIGVGGRKAWIADMELGRRFGIYQSTCDTFGVGGVSRALRMIPVLTDVARDMEELCPHALYACFSNPLSMNMRAISLTGNVALVGLCSGTINQHHGFSAMLGVDSERLLTRAVGTNHFTWFTRCEYEGEDMFPKLLDLREREIAIDPGRVERGQLTWDLFKAFGAYPVVGDVHIAEFIPGMQDKGAMYGKTLGVDAQGFNFDEYARSFDGRYEAMRRQALGDDPLDTSGIHPSAKGGGDEGLLVDVLNAYIGNGDIRTFVNLPNRGQVSNLPEGVVLEGSAMVSKGRFEPMCFGNLPPGISAMLHRIASVQEVVVEAALKGDRGLVVQALLAGLTVRTLGEAEALTDAILMEHKVNLPQFA